ncbi:hypothetical protein EI94DRAFT_1709400 [Lactarius quietus]|nr:hypothetical protein EI94DRAFT_1709400 [Lactarius quietus]
MIIQSVTYVPSRSCDIWCTYKATLSLSLFGVWPGAQLESQLLSIEASFQLASSLVDVTCSSVAGQGCTEGSIGSKRYTKAHTSESRAQEDIEEEEAIRALVAAEDDSYLTYDEACKVRQLRPEAAYISGLWLPLCYDLLNLPASNAEAHTWESHAEEDIKEEEAVRALIVAEDDSYLAYDEACKVRQLSSRCWQEGDNRTSKGHVTWSCDEAPGHEI